MTERGRGSLTRTRDVLLIGPSSLEWRNGVLTIRVNEIAAPLPKPIRGEIRLEPRAVNKHEFLLETHGRHLWRPIAPMARVSLDLDAPRLCWKGHGYFDANSGDEPLEEGFSFWSWSRGNLGDGAAILYDAERRREAPLSLALRFSASGEMERLDAPPPALLPSTRWRVQRRTRADDGVAQALCSFEDTPFYSRSLISAKFGGEMVRWVNESLSLDRFANPIVRLMLPFRMPRRA